MKRLKHRRVKTGTKGIDRQRGSEEEGEQQDKIKKVLRDEVIPTFPSAEVHGATER